MLIPWRQIFLRSIQARLLFFIFLVVFVPLVVLGVVTFRASSSIIAKSVTLNTSETLGQVLYNIEFYLRDMENVSADVLFSPTVINSLRKTNGKYDLEDIEKINQIKSVLSKQITLHRGVRSVFLMGDNYFYMSGDHAYVSSNNEHLTQLMKEQSWYTKAVTRGGNSFFTIIGQEDSPASNALTVEGAKEPTIRLSRLLRDIQSGHPIGVLGIDLDYQVIERIVSKLQTKFNGSLLLVDEDGNAIYKRDPENWLNASEAWNQLDGVQRESGVDELTVQGKKMLRIYRTSPVSGWRLIELIPYSELLAPVEFIRKLTFFLVLICLAAALIMSVFISNRIVTPIKQLVALMKQIKQGELNVKLGRVQQDEIGDLIQSFNHMTESLKEMRGEIYREQELKRQAELAALQAQIQPHFLYNTLDSIKWMAVIRGEQQISEMISALVNLLRNSISLGKETITVQKEIENLKHYIQLQKMRYYDSFVMDYQIDEQVLHYGIPKLILQPLVENALFHGIEGLDRVGRIELHVWLEEGHIQCKLRDNGKGMAPGIAEEILRGRVKSRFSGISVKNVDERLKLNYGKHYGLTFHSDEGCGTEVTFRIPAIPVKEKMQIA